MSKKKYKSPKKPVGSITHETPVYFGKYRQYRTWGEVPAAYLLHIYDNFDIDMKLTEYINNELEELRSGKSKRPKR